MNKAAQMLGTSQPAISCAVADLEHAFGVRLFDRGPQGILPTPYGQALLKRSIAVFDEIRLGVEDLESLADPESGEVRIATTVNLAGGLVAAVIERLARQHPRIVCHLAASADGGS